MYHDHHLHPLGYAGLVTGLDLYHAPDLATVLDLVQRRSYQSEGAVVGQRLNEEGLDEGRLPDRDDLDRAVARRPVLLYRYCGHVAVANSEALRLAGVDQGTPDPSGGEIERDPSGRPTGVVRETAVTLVSRALADQVQPPSDPAILSALAGLGRLGIGSITGIVSVGEPIWCGVPSELDTLCRLAPDLPLDVEVLVIAAAPGELAEAAERIRRAEGRLRFLGWKEFADGSFGGRTAALHEPYSDQPGNVGMHRLDTGQARTMARASLMLGGSVAIHAIGDRANDSVLDLYEDLIGQGADPGRLRIEHASLLTEEAIERMARLGVTASVQPAFLASAASWLQRRLGEERMARVYPFRSLIEAGVPLLGGSDAPVESPDPEVGIRAAVDRIGFPGEETLTEAQARALFAPPARG